MRRWASGCATSWRVVFHWRCFMRPSLVRRNILSGSISRSQREHLFQVFWKTTVAQGQMLCAAQTEFVICDQSIDVNHGYAQTPVINSEVAKKREALQRRLDNVKRWADGARKRMHNASTLYRKRCTLTKERADALYRDLNTHQMELARQGMDHWQVRQTIKAEKAAADAEIEVYQQRNGKAYHASNKG